MKMDLLTILVVPCGVLTCILSWFFRWRCCSKAILRSIVCERRVVFVRGNDYFVKDF